MDRKKTERYLRRLVFALGAAAFAAPAGQAAETNILFNEFAPSHHIINKGIVNPWMAEVTRATQGRVTFKVPPTSLAPPPRQLDIVKGGIADGAYIFNAFLVKKAPLIQVSLLPGVTRSALGSAVALWRTYEKFFAKAREFDDVVLLGFFATPPGEIFSLGAPIATLADFKGRKIWSLPGNTAKAVGALGAAVVPGPAVRVYEVVSKGTVDAFIGISISSADQFNVTRFATSATLLPEKILGPTFSLFLSRTKWRAISAADRKAIRAVSGEALARLTAAADALEKEHRAKFVGSGKKVIEASAALTAGLSKTWARFHEDWIAAAAKRGVDGKAALDFFRRTAAETGG